MSDPIPSRPPTGKRNGGGRGGRRQKAGRVRRVLEGEGNAIGIVTVLSVILSTLIAVPWISPLLHSLAVVPFYYVSMKQQKHRWSLDLVLRWAIVLLATIVVVGVFAPGRVGESLPLAHEAAVTAGLWLDGGSPVWNYGLLLWGMAAFLLATAATGGILAFPLGSIAFGCTAYAALFFFKYGDNVLQITIVAVPIWQWFFFGAAAFLLIPAALPAFERFFKCDRITEDRSILRNYMYIGGACFALSLLLRLIAAGTWQNILQKWTLL